MKRRITHTGFRPNIPIIDVARSPVQSLQRVSLMEIVLTLQDK